MKVIVWVNVDGSLRVTYPANAPRDEQTEEELLDSVRARVVAADLTIDALPYHYVETYTLPARVRDDGGGGTINVRHAWRWDGSQVYIDETKV